MKRKEREAQPPVRVLLVDDHQCMTAGLARLLQDETDLTVVGAASCLAEAFDMLANRRPDIVLLDLQLSRGESGFTFLSHAKAVAPALRVIVLSTFDDAAYRRQAEAIGAAGFVTKGEDLAVLKRTIRDVLATDAAPSGFLPVPGLCKTLSRGEELVVRCLARGLSQKEAAAELGIAASTVATHVQRAKEKLGVKSVAQLIVIAGAWAGGGGKEAVASWR